MNIKNLLYTLAFISFAAVAQDGYNLSNTQYIEVGAKVNELDSLNALKFADHFISSSGQELQLYKVESQGSSRGFNVIYMPSELTANQMDSRDYNGCDACVLLYFKKENEAYALGHVFGSYETLFPAWKNEFLPAAVKAQAPRNFKMREVVNQDHSVDIRLSKTGNSWQITNLSR